MPHVVFSASFRRVAAILLALLALTGCERAAEKPQKVFDFERLSESGGKYQGNGDFAAEPWACVHDRGTGLTWEVIIDGRGPHSRDYTYSWFEPDAALNHGDPGKADSGGCATSTCDIHGLVGAVNAAGWCGFNDWRVPAHQELATIVDPRVPPPGPTIDSAYFPDTQSGEYWTMTSYRFHAPGAWAWGFEVGLDRVDEKPNAKFVRLVRGNMRGRAESP